MVNKPNYEYLKYKQKLFKRLLKNSFSNSKSCKESLEKF